ncbi:MAG: hypothetical protein JOZ33_12690 [Acidobacteriaceae bacterium]|nr:hypothetical protein [Acidobacteriaceae bacterium]
MVRPLFSFQVQAASTLILLLLGAAVGVNVAAAQDVYKVNYFSNNTVPGAPDATVRIDNPGLTYGNVCAMIYVFAADQQMAECCGCVQSHNNLTTYSVATNLASPAFTLTGQFTPSGVIKIVSAPFTGICDPTSSYKPIGNLRAWGTHIQNPVGGKFPITETEFSDSTLGATELANLQAQCSFINILGSGFGICQCGSVVY